jgi:hypothetical protein
MTVCCVKIRTSIITKLEKITTGKKGTVVWSSVGAQNTKQNTHGHNNQQDEPCHPTFSIPPSYLEVSFGDTQEHPLGAYLEKESLYFKFA